MVAFSDSKVKMIPPPRAPLASESAAEYDAAVCAHVIKHIRTLPEFVTATTLVGASTQGGLRAGRQLAKAVVVVDGIVTRIPLEQVLEGYNAQFVLRLAGSVAVAAWHVLRKKGADSHKVKKAPIPATTPAPAHSVSNAGARQTRARQPLAKGPYDASKRPAKRVAPSSAADDELVERMSRTSLDDGEVQAAVKHVELQADAMDELCSSLSKTHIAPPVPAAPEPVPTLFAVPVFATVPAPGPAAAPAPDMVMPPPPSAPRRATVDLPEVDTTPVYYAPAAAPEPLIYIPCVRKTRAPAPTRSPYNKASRPAHRKPVKLAPPPVLDCDAEVPYIEAVTETFSGEHLFTEVHVLDAHPLRDGRLARRESRGWRRIAVA